MPRTEQFAMTLSFTKSGSDSSQTKARDFWKFLDSRNEMQPQRPTPRITKSIYSCGSTKPKPPSKDQSSSDNEGQHDTVWQDCLHVFQTFGLDKTALSAGKTCKLCNTQRRIEETANFADTMTQSYDELSAELTAYEERLAEKKMAAKIENRASPKTSN